MSLRDPQFDNRVRGGSYVWDTGAGPILEADYFAAAGGASAELAAAISAALTGSGNLSTTINAPVVGASVAKGYNNDTTAISAAVTTAASTGILVFAHWEGSATPPTITDSRGNAYGAPFRPLPPTGGGIVNHQAAWFITGAAGGSGHTFTATGQASSFPSIFVVEVPGAATIAHTGAVAAASPYSSGNITTARGALLIGFAGAENTSAVTQTVDANFAKVVELTNGAAEWTGVIAQRTVGAGTYGFSASVTASQDGGAFLVALSTSLGGGPIELAASSTGPLAGSGNLSTAIRLAASGAGSGALAGTLTTSIRLAGAATGSGTGSGALTTAIRLAAGPTGALTGGGTLTTAIRLAGAATGSGVVSGALTTAIRLQAAVTDSLVASGSLGGGPVTFAAAATGSLVVSGNLSTSIRLAGSASGSLTAAPAPLSTQTRFAAAVTGSLSGSAALATSIRLAGAGAGSLAAGATLSTSITLQAAPGASLIAAPAGLVTAIRLAGDVAVSLLAGGELQTIARVVRAPTGRTVVVAPELRVARIEPDARRHAVPRDTRILEA